MKNRAVFLDRDGVLNEAIVKGGQSFAPRSFGEFRIFPGAGDAVRKAKELGFIVIVFTNQPDVPRGIMKREEVERMNLVLKEQMPIDEICVCFHDDKDNCGCRKPKPGMLTEAARKWDIDLGLSFVIGDTWRDMGAGRSAGCRTLLLRREYNAKSDTGCDFTVDSLDAAVELIKREAGKA
jgi:D-glycero-D-manno-heptose 1,7-bisphosphate phosphatase